LESLGFVLRYDDGGERLSVTHDAGSKYWGKQVLIRQYESEDRVIYVDLTDLDWLIGALKLVAIAMEARQGTDPKGLDGEAATARAEGIAQARERDR
jgi:hypothetical protein